MKILEPKAEMWLQGSGEQAAAEHVAKCASVCYGSEPKKGEAADKFVNALVRSNHVSVLRHESCYYMIPSFIPRNESMSILKTYQYCPYIEYIETEIGDICVVTNRNFLHDNELIADWLKPFMITPQKMFKEMPELMRYTFCLTTQISTSRELNRVSPNNITEASTRYIKGQEAIVRPHWFKGNGDLTDKWITMQSKYLQECDDSFVLYDEFLGNGMKPEDARGILPLDTATKVVYTYSVYEWRNIINLRYWGTTGKPHPHCRTIIGMVKEELEKLGYEFPNPKE